MCLGFDIFGICLGMAFVICVYGIFAPRISASKSLDRLARKWEEKPMSPVFFEYPEGKTVECVLFMEIDETGTTAIIARPKDKEQTHG